MGLAPVFPFFLTPFLPAPMEGYSDSVLYRRLAALGGCGAWITRFSRITAAGTAHPRLEELLPPDSRLPTVVQLLGRDPEKMAAAARLAASLGFRAVDLNFACPARVVTAKRCGAALLDEPRWISAILAAVRDAVAPLPVTAKIRAGRRDSGNFDEILKRLRDGGAALVTVHGRLEIQGYADEADWRYVDRAIALTGLPIVGNGDIADGWAAVKRLRGHGCAAVMCGRGMIARPGLFAEAQALLQGRIPKVWTAACQREHLEIMGQEYLQRFGSPSMALARLKAQLAPLRDAKFARPAVDTRPLLRARSLEEYLQRLPDVFFD